MENVRTKLVGLVLATAVALGAGVGFAGIADAQIDRSQQREERLQEMVDDGVITDERADEIRARMADRAARQADRRSERTERLEALASTLGTTADELKADLRAGASIADLADAASVDIVAIIDQIEVAQTARITQAVTDGRIDQARADEILEGLRDRITDRVNGEHHAGFRGPHHGRSRGG